VAVPQTGIFALGNLSHTYLELELRDQADAAALVKAVAELSEPRTTMGGGSYDVVFDAAIEVIAALSGLADVVEEIVSWSYHRDRDLTGFVDGTENPSLLEAPQLVLVPAGTPGAGGSVLLLQKWAHDAAAWGALGEERQEQVMGRTKPGSIELADKPASSHVARTDQEEFGDIFRRNTP
jgi:putative iron-dependent peroxidase